MTRRLRARRVGTRQIVDEKEREAGGRDGEDVALPLSPRWRRTFWGAPMPNWAAAVRRSRSEH